jgi:hypothetical protein
VSAGSAAITTNLISSSSVTTAVSAISNPGIQPGSIRVVQPHQLTGTTATTILAPVSIPVAVNCGGGGDFVFVRLSSVGEIGP